MVTWTRYFSSTVNLEGRYNSRYRNPSRSAKNATFTRISPLTLATLFPLSILTEASELLGLFPFSPGEVLGHCIVWLLPQCVRSRVRLAGFLGSGVLASSIAFNTLLRCAPIYLEARGPCLPYPPIISMDLDMRCATHFPLSILAMAYLVKPRCMRGASLPPQAL